MTEPTRRWQFWLWTTVVVLVLVHQVQFWRAPRLDTDVLALLPADTARSTIDRATRALAESGSRRIVVAIGAPQESIAVQAARVWRESLPDSLGWKPLRPDADLANRLLEFYRPWRQGLLTAAQRDLLQTSRVDDLASAALAALYQPGQGTALTSWAGDPLGLWPDWWVARAGETLAQPRGGELMLDAKGLSWVVLLFDSGAPAFALDGTPVIARALEHSRAQAMAQGAGIRIVAAGIPLHAEAAAVGANREINTIGWGSAAAVLILVWLAFRRVRSLALVGLSLLVGTLTALSVTASVFGGIHLITLVFGATLVGVAEDFGIHYLASRQASPGKPPRDLVTSLLPALGLALATSVMGYLVLGLAPFPGLRQIALFSSVGLVAAFLTVVCWFPTLDGAAPPPSRFAAAIAASIDRVPRWRATWPQATVAAVLGLGVVAGLYRLQPDDSLRQLQSSPAALVADQRELSELLGLPSANQFFLVTGATTDEVLAREEALKEKLRALVSRQQLSGYRALTDWLPSSARQSEDSRLVQQAEAAVVARVNATLGEALQQPASAGGPLLLDRWLASPVASANARDLWLGRIDTPDSRTATYGSVVIPRGIHDGSALPALAAAAVGLPGVAWVDKASDMAGMLGSYRQSMSWLLLAGHVLVFAILALRYGRRAWRAYLPTALATLIAVATLGVTGIPLQLFNVLALLLLLGVGVDYGIFLLEHHSDGPSWLAVVLGSTSTLLAFGLLGLSSTPALHAFGVTLGVGLLAVALLSPVFRADPTDFHHRESP